MSEPTTRAQRPPQRARPHRVLVVESDRLIEALIVEWLQMAGYESLLVRDIDACCSGGGGSCEVVLADVRAPLESAQEVVARLTRAMPGTPVVAMSADVVAWTDSASEALAHELGADAMLVKPFSRQALLGAISRARASRGASASRSHRS
jgi:DNA-binding response OmpR family regulator